MWPSAFERDRLVRAGLSRFLAAPRLIAVGIGDDVSQPIVAELEDGRAKFFAHATTRAEIGVDHRNSHSLPPLRFAGEQLATAGEGL